MSTEESKSIAERVFEGLNSKNPETLAQCFNDDAQFYGFAPQTLNLEQYKQWISSFFTGFPDGRFVIDDLLAEGDKVSVRHHLSATQTGEFQGIPPTGKPVVGNGIAIFSAKGDKVAATWIVIDALGLMQQLGVIPTPGQ